jgi:FtsZ-interacting cell division protein ZipA
VGLALWELRRPRHAARKSGLAERIDPAGWQDAPTFSADDSRPIDLPDVRDADLRRNPPIVLIDEVTTLAAQDGLQVVAEVAVDRPGAAHAAEEPASTPVCQAPAAEDAPFAVPQALPAVPAAVLIQWPPERQNRILWFRVVGAEGKRFGGRALRQALNGCGLVQGPQDIFHWADESGRVIASAANLLRPGSFDAATMDSQDFPGLHVFSVLPGPLTTLHTYDELLSLARDLAARLQGRVQDERGQLVDEASVEAQRRALADAEPAP